MTKSLAILVLLATAWSVALPAAVPLRWTVETSRVQPAQFEAYHGETIEFAATMQSYGKPLAITNDLIGIYWQTNGMGSAYWTAPAVISNNVMIARFEPSMDVGANVYGCFIGAPGEIYRAAFQLRLRPSPGAVPSELPLPVKTLDFAQVQILHAPYYSKAETDAKIIELAPTPGNYATVSNRAMTAVQPSAIADMETQTHAAANYVPFANTTKTAVKIGGLNTAQSTDGGGTVAIGRNTRALADSSFAGGHRAMTATDTKYSFSFGNRTYAPTGATALGYQAWAASSGQFANEDTDVITGLGQKHKYSFIWQGKDDGNPGYYHSHGDGTFNVNPIGGLTGFWIGSTSLQSLFAAKQDAISDLATIRSSAALGATAVQPAAISDMETQTHAAATYQPKGSYLTTETDPSVDGKIITHNSSTSAHSDIRTALAGKQPTITDLATIRSGAALGATAVQPAAINDMETQTHAAATYQPKGSYLTTETDPSVDGKISTHNSSTSAHSDIRTAISGKQDTISDLSTIRSGAAAGATAVQPASISDMETQTHAAQTYQPKGQYLTSETDPTVSSAISTHNSSDSAHSDIRNALGEAQYNITLAADNALTAMRMAAEAQDTAAAKYAKPSAGIPKTDLAATVQASLGLADSALQSYTESDPTVSSWAKASTKPSYTWSEIGSKPTFATVATSGAYSDLSGRPTIPTALKCPTALTINVNGSLAASYDGSVAKTVNISTGGSPGGTITAATLVYHADGQAVAVSVAQGGTFSATLTDWPDGQSQMAFVTLAVGASVSSTIKLIGYSDWPTGEEFMAVATRRNSKIYINPVCITEE